MAAKGQVVSAAAGEALQHLQSSVNAINAISIGEPRNAITESTLAVESLLSALFSVLSTEMKEDGVIFSRKGHPWDYLKHIPSCLPDGDELLKSIDAIKGITTMTGATRAFLVHALNSSELTLLLSALVYNKDLTTEHYKQTAVLGDPRLVAQLMGLVGVLDKIRFAITMKATFLQPIHNITAHAPVPTEVEEVKEDHFHDVYEEEEIAKWNALVRGTSKGEVGAIKVERSSKKGRRPTSEKAKKKKKHKRSLSAQSSTFQLPIPEPAPYPGYEPTLEDALAVQLPSPSKLTTSDPLAGAYPASQKALAESLKESDRQARPSSEPEPHSAPIPEITFAIVPTAGEEKEEKEEKKEAPRFWSPMRDPFSGLSVNYSSLPVGKKVKKGRRRSNSAPHDVAYQRKAQEMPVLFSSEDEEHSDDGEDSSADDMESLDQLGRHLRRTAGSASYGTDREVELILTIPEHSQPTDHMVCYSCFQTIEEGEEARFCNYTGKYFCPDCHSNKVSVIPARVVQMWCFKAFTVSDYGLRCIASLYSRPVIFASEFLLGCHSDVPKLKKRRKQLHAMWKVAKQCPDTAAVKKYLDDREYYLVSSNYSLKDLVDIFYGHAWEFLSGAISVLAEHLHQCSRCQKKGVVCSKCLDVDDRLFIFDSIRARQCHACKAICHGRCCGANCTQCNAPYPKEAEEDEENSFVVFDEPNPAKQEEADEENKEVVDVALKMAGRLVLVIGATSDLGMLVTTNLLAAGVSVRAMTRNAHSTRGEELSAKGADVVHYDDPSEEERLNEAMHGCYAVYAAIEDGFWVAGSMADGTDVCQGPQALIMDVADRSGVKRIVYCLYGAIAAEDKFRHVHAHTSRGELEKYMWLNTELAWTVVRPAPLMERFVLPKYQPKYHWSMFKHHRKALGRKLPLVGLKDLAVCLKEILCEEQPLLREVVDIAGDELSYEQACAAYKEAVGDDPPCMRVALPLWLLSVIHPHLVAAATHFKASDFRTIDLEAVRNNYSSLRSFADYAEEELLTVLPPRWVDDSEADSCQQCSAEFTLTNRRHHCRNCGQVLCKKCTAHTASLPWYHLDKPARICSQCYVDHLDQILAENRRPNWEADHASKSCQNCGTSFSLLSRRHHCRNCGRLLCSECTPHMAGIPKFHYYSPVRICRDCYARSTVIQLGALYKIKHNPIRAAVTESDFIHDSSVVPDSSSGINAGT